MRLNTECLTVLAVALAVLAFNCDCQMLTEVEKADALQFINYLRRSTVPRAADMNGLLWDPKLEYLAQKAANSCVFAHNYGGKYASLGETLYLGGSRNFRHIFTFMFLERENYNFSTGVCGGTGAKYPFFNTCGHYLQLVSAGVTYIGCGIQLCNGAHLAACEFNRQYSNPPYQTGEIGTKCGNGLATYYQNGLCYAIMYGQPPPIPGPFECKLICLNNGTLYTTPFCGCLCPVGFYGVRCEKKNIYYPSTLPNDCKAQAVTCKNGGEPMMFNNTCKCVCPDEFRGERCEENVLQMESSVFLHFGGQPIYQSYYPVNVSLWTSTGLRSTVKQVLTNALNQYCLANFTACCPNASLPTASPPPAYVTADSFWDTDNYPAQDLDGTLVAAVHFELSEAAALLCYDWEYAYAAKSLVATVLRWKEGSIKLAAAKAGLKLVRTG